MSGELKNGATPHDLTAEDQRAGGVASVKTRRRKKLFRELIEQYGGLMVVDEKIVDELKAMGIDEEDLTNDMAVVVGQYKQAQKGNTAAFVEIRNTKGEKPVDKVEQTLEMPEPLSPRKKH